MKKKKARKAAKAVKRGPKVAARKAAKNAVRAKAPKRVQLPDLVSGKFCIADGESFLLPSGLNTDAHASDAAEVQVYDTKEDAKTRLFELKRVTEASDGSAYANSEVVPLKTFFANHFSVDDFNFTIAVSLRPKALATPLKVAVGNVRKEIKAEIAASRKTLKALSADVAKAEKDLTAFDGKMAKYGA